MLMITHLGSECWLTVCTKINSCQITTVPAGVRTTWHQPLIWAKNKKGVNLFSIYLLYCSSCNSGCTDTMESHVFAQPALCFLISVTQHCTVNEETLIGPDELWGGMTARYSSLIPWYPSRTSGRTSTIVLKVLVSFLNKLCVCVCMYVCTLCEHTVHVGPPYWPLLLALLWTNTSYVFTCGNNEIILDAKFKRLADVGLLFFFLSSFKSR